MRLCRLECVKEFLRAFHRLELILIVARFVEPEQHSGRTNGLVRIIAVVALRALHDLVAVTRLLSVDYYRSTTISRLLSLDYYHSTTITRLV